MKQCTKCRGIKPETHFWLDKEIGKRIARCDVCSSEDKKIYRLKNAERLKAANRKWQINNPEKVKAAQERWRAKNPDLAKERSAAWYQTNKERAYTRQRQRRRQFKDTAYMGLGGYICNCCGETEPAFLSIDHVNNDGHLHRKRTGFGTRQWSGKKIYDQVIVEGFPHDKFQILCMNCNWGKARNGGICPHKMAEGSTTILSGSTPQAIGGGSAQLLFRCDDAG